MLYICYIYIANSGKREIKLMGKATLSAIPPPPEFYCLPIFLASTLGIH